MKIIVVDDSEIVREMARGTLEDAGFRVILLDSPFSLSKVLQTERPDLALVDVNMPALRGDKVVQITGRHNLFKCPIVLYSETPEAELRAITLQVGAAGCIHKNLTGAEFVAAVRSFLPK